MNVVVRVRASTGSEEHVVTCNDKALIVRKDGGEGEKVGAALEFKFADVFPPQTETAKVYNDTLRPIVNNVLKGTPGCLFAYGQTGSGKTHTVTGTAMQPGLLPMAVGEMLERTAADEEVVTSCVYLTYLEIYNEVIKDLLNPEGPTLNLREDANGRPHLPNMTRVPVASVEDALAIVNEGEKVRAKSANSVHEHSSRSHAIFTITVETRRESEAQVRIGLLHIIDLAGSETVIPNNQTHIQDADQAVEARRALHDIANRHIVERETKKSTTHNREGSHIRRSLLALVRCVQKMAERAPFIPFRDSNLTRLLRAPLEGNSNTAIVCTVNPHEGKETAATLRFAATAQRIHRTPASKVVSLSTEGSLLKSYERELAQLKEEMTRNMEEERRRAEELKLTNMSNMTELERATAEREAMQKKLDAINSKLLKTEKRADGPPTPRTALKIVAFENGRQQRCGSAPNRRGAIFADARDEAVGQPIPKWLRDSVLRSQRQRMGELEAQVTELETTSAAAEAKYAEESAAQSSRITDLEAELKLLREAAKIADEERAAMAAYLQRDAAAANAKKQKKGGLGCGSKKAVAAREEAPALRKFEDIVKSIVAKQH